ncbi:YiiX/YebB-like N1pC/P60 family cysteine hydrolase [Sphingobacterium paucimobilis]|uniref:Peptidoglycan peptidase n=1 Tax=Sphingobacterium paucimobilis HER1398 TaxID=1346330 RepID=U2HTX9_9SPHI|nr:YiiX/YebB-like N1pC/P60 family cysteine hydrolase [Sphingobacterium paucimobilis]ERJ58735.1 hypothetical protein M472_08135 [Sphingobacterium paucimobilis HER1398]
MEKKITVLFVLLCNIFFLWAQDSTVYKGITIQQGDLLFVGAQPENLSGAINRVTQRNAGDSFSHIGLIEIIQGIPYILHATGSKGSVKESLDNMIGDNDRQQYVVYRIDSMYMEAIPKALEKAHQMLGKPYNWSYVLTDSSYYCSDFVERAFRHIALFRLEPMTFKNPQTGTFDDFWLSFYDKLGIAVPEGELGCNPNGLAASTKIYRVGTLEIEK